MTEKVLGANRKVRPDLESYLTLFKSTAHSWPSTSYENAAYDVKAALELRNFSSKA